MASLLYGAGLRLMECLRLRIKDADFATHHRKDRTIERFPTGKVNPLRLDDSVGYAVKTGQDGFRAVISRLVMYSAKVLPVGKCSLGESSRIPAGEAHIGACREGAEV
jgi:integrase